MDTNSHNNNSESVKTKTKANKKTNKKARPKWSKLKHAADAVGEGLGTASSVVAHVSKSSARGVHKGLDGVKRVSEEAAKASMKVSGASAGLISHRSRPGSTFKNKKRDNDVKEGGDDDDDDDKYESGAGEGGNAGKKRVGDDDGAGTSDSDETRKASDDDDSIDSDDDSLDDDVSEPEDADSKKKIKELWLEQFFDINTA